MHTENYSLFNPIYEKYLSKNQNPTPQTDRQKSADIIFMYREFSFSLKNEHKEKLTAESFSKFCNKKNFEKFILSFNTQKNSKENLIKRKQIEEQVWISEKCPPITTEAYDIDIVKAYYEIVKLLDTVVYDIRYRNKEEYLEGIKYPIIFYCKKNDLPFDYIFQNKYPIIVDSTIYGFETYVGRTLIAYDTNKVDAILSYQNIAWKGEGLFVTIVEHGVYNYVLHNSPFDNNARLKAIMDWVTKHRKFALVDKDGNIITDENYDEALKTKSKKYEEPKVTIKNISPSFTLIAFETNNKYFVLKANEVMDVLKGLKKDNFISNDTKLESFKNIFSGKVIKPENRVNWIGSYIELKLAISILMLQLNKLKKIYYKWETAVKCFIKDGDEIEVTQLDKANGKKDNEEKLRTILNNL